MTRLSFAALAVLCLWLRLPRLQGPLDLRFDAGVYYVLGTSLAEGKGYRILSEPGEIHGVQYPPLLPALAAAHQLALGTSDPDIVGRALRWTYFLLFTAYVLAVFWMASAYLPHWMAFIAALIVALHVRTNFHAEYFVAELPFALVATLFFGVVGRGDGRRGVLSGVLAVVGFLLRTLGITLLAAWVGESLLRRRFRQALIRGVVALLPLAAWQWYTASVKQGPEYAHPAYPYQRASYMIYNVTYGENLWLRETLRPESGRVSMADLLSRVGSNAVKLATTWGESVSVREKWWEDAARRVDRIAGRRLLPLSMGAVAPVFLTLLVVAGLILLAVRGAWLVPCYVVMSVGLVILTPFGNSLERYLASLAPLSAVALLGFLAWVWAGFGRRLPARMGQIGRLAVVLVILAILTQEIHALRTTHRLLDYPATWVDARGRQRTYPLYAYDRPWRLHDEALAWLRRRAKPADIVATSTPHWAFLKTGLKAVQPPFEPDPEIAERLMEAVPVEYLIIDNLAAYEQAPAVRRYSVPVVQAFPERWNLIYARPDSGARIYERVVAPR